MLYPHVDHRPLAALLAAIALCLLSPFVGAGALPSPGNTVRPAPAAPLSASPDWMTAMEREIREAEYEVSWQDRTVLPGLRSAWQAPNRAQDLRFYFTADGLRVAGRTAADETELLRLAVAGVGRGGVLTAPDPEHVTFQADGARIELRRPGLTETFVNEPAGLTHLLAIATRPAGDGPLEIALSWRAAGIRPTASSVQLFTESGRRLVFTIGEVRDATGAALENTLRSGAGGDLVLEVDDRGAVYPLLVKSLLTATPDTVLEGNVVDLQLGFRGVVAGDFNGDGYADVAAVVPLRPSSLGGTGAVLVFHGGPDGIPSNGTGLLDDAADTIIECDIPGFIWPTELGAIGDVNGDGYDDLAAGSPIWYPAPPWPHHRGRVWVFHGSPTGINASAASDADASIVSDVDGAEFGGSIAAAGDVNGDGYADIVVGAFGWSDSALEYDEGAAFIFHGSASGITATTIDQAATVLEGNEPNLWAGSYPTGVGDLDGDGFDDVALSLACLIHPEWHEGAIAILYGGDSGIASNPTQPLADRADTLIEGNAEYLYLGIAARGWADVNGDGYSDLVIGAPMWESDPDSFGEGALLVFHGRPERIPSNGLALPTDVADTVIEGNPNPSYRLQLGCRVIAVGDVNGDGFGDVVATANLFKNPDTAEGAVFVFLGQAGGIPSSRVLPVQEVADIVIEGNVASLALGETNPGAGDVNGDGYDDVVLGVPCFTNEEEAEGAVWIFHGMARGPGATAGWTVASGQGGSAFGVWAAAAGDVNGDGYDDVVVGASDFDVGGVSVGRAFVYHGSPSGPSTVPDWTVSGSIPGEQLGWAVAGAGDVNGDGYGDLVVGAWHFSDTAVDEGRALVFHGSAGGLSTVPSWQKAGGFPHVLFGESVAGAGDVNGDGFGDVVIGAPGSGDGGGLGGTAMAFLGSADGLRADPIWTFELDQPGAYFGASVAWAGDVNGDGRADVVVGAPFYSDGEVYEGKAFIFHGAFSGLTPVPCWAVAPDRDYAYFGMAVSSAGDLDADGYADVLVGAPGDSNPEPDEGRVSIYHGSASGLSSSPLRVLEIDRAGAKFGMSVAPAGDVNSDGFADILVGAPEDPDGATASGRAYLFLGSVAGAGPARAWMTAGQAAYDLLGQAVAGAGDVNGDGFADVLVSAPGMTATVQGEGGAQLYFGGGGQGGRPVLAAQLRGGGDPTPVPPWGLSHSEGDFQVRMRATSPRGRELARLHVEACPPSAPFGDAACHHAISAGWTPIPVSPGGTDLVETVTGLTPDVLYHWRAHVQYQPLHGNAPGITAPPVPRHGPWRTLSSWAPAADLRVGQPQEIVLAFVTSSSWVPEGGGTIEIPVVVHTSDTVATRLPVAFQWATSGGTATEGVDFVHADGVVELLAGTPDGQVMPLAVEILDDSVVEPDEDLGIDLFAACGAVIGQGFHQVWIVDDDDPGLIFQDGFESGNASAWSGSLP